jgi:hypothetical protein
MIQRARLLDPSLPPDTEHRQRAPKASLQLVSYHRFGTLNLSVLQEYAPHPAHMPERRNSLFVLLLQHPAMLPVLLDLSHRFFWSALFHDPVATGRPTALSPVASALFIDSSLPNAQGRGHGRYLSRRPHPSGTQAAAQRRGDPAKKRCTPWRCNGDILKTGVPKK